MYANTSSYETSGISSHRMPKSIDEILHNGYWYNVTNFVNTHPGGSIIKFYTDDGEDATHAIQQFHYRSKEKVESIMKTFRRRAAELNDCSGDRNMASRHKILTEDFNKLFEELKAEGYFEPSISHVVIRVVEILALLTFTFGCFLCSQNTMQKLMSTIICGFAMSRVGWLMHEAGHNSLTGCPKIDKLIQNLAIGFTLGCSSMWWNSQHNRHHSMPQRLEHDVDLATLPFVAFHKRTVKHRNDIHPFFIRYQAIFYWTLDLLVVTIAWRFFIHPRYQLHKKAYHELVLGIPNLLFMLFIVGPIWYYLMAYWLAFFLGINFALSHSHLDVAEKPSHWIEYSFTHTSNIRPSLFSDYFMGYLNYQIEHHLFPTMPQFRQKEICHRVKALAKKHGLPYRAYGYFEACSLVFKNLDNVGKELTIKLKS